MAADLSPGVASAVLVLGHVVLLDRTEEALGSELRRLKSEGSSNDDIYDALVVLVRALPSFCKITGTPLIAELKYG